MPSSTTADLQQYHSTLIELQQWSEIDGEDSLRDLFGSLPGGSGGECCRSHLLVLIQSCAFSILLQLMGIISTSSRLLGRRALKNPVCEAVIRRSEAPTALLCSSVVVVHTSAWGDPKSYCFDLKMDCTGSVHNPPCGAPVLGSCLHWVP